MEVYAIKLKQKENNIFLTVIEAGILVDNYEIDKWSEGDINKEPLKKGYQRELIKAHYRKIVNYLKDDDIPIPNILPGVIIATTRNKIKFEKTGLENIVKITLNKLWIIDGQHRVRAFQDLTKENKHWKEFKVPLEILDDFDKVEEAFQFWKINATSKRVKTDLAEQLIRTFAEDENFKRTLIEEGQEWKLIGLDIIDILNDREISPLFNKIKRPNSPNGVISQTSFLQSLKPLINNLKLIWDLNKIANFLINYWGAMKTLLSNCFLYPKNFVLLKTTGTFTLNEVATLVFEYCRAENNFKTNFIKSILGSSSKLMEEDYWKVKGEASKYNSIGAFRYLAHSIMEEIKRNKKIEPKDINL